jgi:hypothetical protein
VQVETRVAYACAWLQLLKLQYDVNCFQVLRSSFTLRFYVKGREHADMVGRCRSTLSDPC